MKQQAVTNFLSELATLLETGIHLLRALELLIKVNNTSRFTQVLIGSQQTIRSGKTLTQAMNRYPKVFDNNVLSFIHSGEQTGQLELCLKKLFQQRVQQAKLRSQLIRSLTYPIVLLFTSLLITTLLLVFVVPQFQSFYQSFNKSLPWITLLVIHCSSFLEHYFFLITAIIIIALLAVITLVKQSSRCKYFFQQSLLTIPIIKSLLKTALANQFYTTLLLYLSSGLTLSEGFSSCIKSCNNLPFQQALLKVQKQIQQGYSIATSISPNIYIAYADKQLIYIAEESGTLENALLKLSKKHQRDLNKLAKNLSSLVEPFFLILLGCIISVILLAIYLPIFQLGF
jgi:type II secretory pathway component PulF